MSGDLRSEAVQVERGFLGEDMRGLSHRLWMGA